MCLACLCLLVLSVDLSVLSSCRSVGRSVCPSALFLCSGNSFGFVGMACGRCFGERARERASEHTHARAAVVVLLFQPIETPIIRRCSRVEGYDSS